MHKPFKLNPAFKDYLWGGTKLKTNYNKKCDFDIVAESWELSAHPDGESVISSGEFTGMGFAEFVAKYPEACGNKYDKSTGFPVLVKLIDAKGALSVQVHPGDEYAQRVEGEPGKTEMWIILEAEPNAFIYYGFEKEITKEEMASRIQSGTLIEVLHKQLAQKGDVFFIPAGTIHAIGAGLLVAEVQQSSNSTYRVDDFGRVGADGKLRALHVEKALDVTMPKPADNSAGGAKTAQAVAGGNIETLAACEYFTVKRLCLSGEYTLPKNTESFCSVLCTDGAAKLCFDEQQLVLAKGDSAFIPANFGGAMIVGNGEFILSFI